MEKSFDLQMKLHESINGYIGKISIDTNILSSADSYNINSVNTTSSGNVETIVILDRSGSMGADAPRLANQIIPAVFNNLGYDESSKLFLIAYDDKVETYEMTPNELRSLKLPSRGSTYMTLAVQALKNRIYASKSKNIRLLTLSDGILDDQIKTLEAASGLAPELKDKFSINSQAIRFFTSRNQPDTRGLSSFLQLNTVGTAHLLDIDSKIKDTDIIPMISELFKGDGLDYQITLTCGKNLLKTSPWTEGKEKLTLFNGDNTVFFKELPEELFIVTNSGVKLPVKIINSVQVNLTNFGDIMQDKIDYYINQLKLLKIINTQSSLLEVQNIIKYFSELEKTLEARDSTDVDLKENTNLKARMEYYKSLIKKRERSVFNKMNQIANDDKVSQLNSAQQADYLRQVELTKTSKGLAKRSVQEGLNFDEEARKEVIAMHAHLNELKDIDDSDHTVSFYSTCTTMDGIKAVCQLVDNGLIDSMDVNDIIKLLNIVGIGVDSPVGDFPDPMTWRITQVYLGCYISMSDILMAFEVSGGKALIDVNTKKEIINVIPVFDDVRIHKFFRKYAPTLLEYTASIGMRRVIANVPLTYGNTLSNGVWKMIECIDKSKSDINIKTFINLTKTFETAIGGYFNHVMDNIKEQDETLSYYIANNGITNMISPIIKMIQQDNTKYMSRILRALYAFESYQYARRILRPAENPDTESAEVLKDLLGIDYEKHGTKVPGYFEVDEFPVFHDTVHVNESRLDTMLKETWYIDYVTLLPECLAHVYSDDSVKKLQNVPQMSEETIVKALGINYDYRTFRLVNLVQSFIFHRKEVRVDDDNKKMKIIDLGKFEAAQKFLKDYVRGLYNNKYALDLLMKSKVEKQMVVDELVKAHLECKTTEEFIKLFKEGITRGNCSAIITDSSKIGYIPLKESLLDLTKEVPIRAEKLCILLLGTDSKDNIVWNNGNAIRVDLTAFEICFAEMGKEHWFEGIKEIYKKKKLHVYRDLPNRHGHDNDKPSYWAFGYAELKNLYETVSEEEWKQYCSIHNDCCGVKTFVWDYEQKKEKQKQKEIEKEKKKEKHNKNNKNNINNKNKGKKKINK
jgi:hypothetical protein